MIENKLLLLDIDGTIIFPLKELDPELARYLKLYNDSNSLLITTARPPQGVKHVFNKYFEFIPTISLNGGGLHLISWDQFDEVININDNYANKIFNLAKSYIDVVVSCYTPDGWFVSNINDEIRHEAKAVGFQPSLFEKNIIKDCIKILLIGNVNSLIKIQKELILSSSNSVVSYFSNNNYLEITSSKTNKAFFVSNYLNKIYKLKREQIKILFVGDSESDVECAKIADNAWTYSYAPESLKSYCSLIEVENGEGLKLLLKQIRSRNEN